MKKLNIGDSVKLNKYLSGVVEDYDDSYFHIRDTNGYNHKIPITDNVTSITKLKQMFNTINEETFNNLIKLDPTYTNNTNVSGKYAEWILRLYKNNKITSNDFSQVTEDLNLLNSNLQRLKALNVNTDINTYKTLNDLESSLEKLDVKSNARKNRETRAAARQSNDIEHFMSTENFDIYIPLTYEASVKLGTGTEWCTATNSTREHYDKYTEDGNKLYVMINKNDKSEKYQWNTKERYTCDKHDDEIEEMDLCIECNDLAEFFDKFGYDDIKDEIEKIKELQSKPYVYDGENMNDDIRPYIKNVIVKNGVTELRNYFFSECKALQSIIIPNSVTKIGIDCFYRCTSLQSITMPNSVTELGYGCFKYCTSLQSIEIPNGVTKLGEECFLGCEFLQSIEIPNGVTKLGRRCFVECTSLQSITIPNSVTELGHSCFVQCSSLQSIEIPNSVTELGHSCFYKCFSLQSIEIPNSVTKLGDGCFERCKSLRSIEIPNSVTKLEDFCFAECSSLQSIEIPNSVTEIGYDCFEECFNLTVKTSNKYVIDYCEKHNVEYERI